MIGGRYTETVIKCTVIAVVWALFCLPTVFYLYRPPSPSQFTSNSTGCAVYNKSTCLEVLNQLKNGSSSEHGNDSRIYIAASVDQEANENIAKFIVLGASQTCISMLMPFMCMYLFPLCGANVTISREQCIEVSTGVCKDDWQNALSIPVIKDKIPNCNSFATTGQEMIPSFFNISISKTTGSVLVNCSDQFILINETCRPLCDKLTLFTNENSYLDFVIIFMDSIFGLLWALLLMISFYIWRKKMFVFPSIIIPYGTITITVFALFGLISSVVDRRTLFCSSQDFTQALQQPTKYCSLTGAINNYVLIQLGTYWLCHVSIIFMKTQFPFYSRGLEKSKTIHLTVVLLAVLLPCIPVIVAFVTGGYLTSLYPLNVCLMKNPDAAYYSFALILSIMCAIGGPLWFITFVTAVKHNLMKRRNGNVSSLPSTEMKILIVLCYFAVLAPVIVANTTITALNTDELIAAFANYFACEATGTNPKCDDMKKTLEPLTAIGPVFSIHLLMGCFPVVLLLYAVNFGAIQQKCASLWSSLLSEKPTSAEAMMPKGSDESQGTCNGTQKPARSVI